MDDNDDDDDDSPGGGSSMYAADNGLLEPTYDACCVDTIGSVMRNGEDGAILVVDGEGRSKVYMFRRCNQARACEEDNFMVSGRAVDGSMTSYIQTQNGFSFLEQLSDCSSRGSYSEWS